MKKNKHQSSTRFRLPILIGLAIASSLSAGVACAQTPEQIQLINQLPASQRQAALQQLRQLSRQQTQPQSEPVPTQVPGAEPVEPTGTEGQALASDTGRLGSGDTIVISVQGASAAMPNLAARIRDANPYQLSDAGLVAIPGVGEINLAGLDEEQARIRLQSEPVLDGLSFKVALMPVKPVGVDALKPFGYSLFEGESATQRGDMSVPVPTDYTIGPGDTLRVQLFGNQTAFYELSVERDGTVAIPELGPLTVGGMSFGQVRDFIAQRVSEQLIGTQAGVSMGALRSVQVFLVGDVNAPGSYSVGALSTMTTVLAMGGGVAEHGTLRRIELKRGGRRVGVLDVYDLLLRGDTSGDLRVQAGDVVFVPPVGARAAITGEVKRPAIYEYKGDADVADIVTLAGGMTPSAFGAGTKIDRLVPETGFRTIDANVTTATGRSIKVRDGDVIRIPGTPDRLQGSVTVVGNAERPGTYQWREGLRLSDLIPGTDYVKPGSDIHYVLIRRQETSNATPTFFSADLEVAWKMKGGPVDLAMRPRDTVYVLDLEGGRAQFVAPVIQELRLLSSSDRPLQVVRVGGKVNAPGQVPLEPGMRISDLIRAGGGLSQSAYTGDAELTRYSVDGDVRTTSIVNVDVAEVMRGDERANLLLQPFDSLNVRETPMWTDEESVELVGEFRFPGVYSIRRGERLSSVIQRAGGLTDLAYTPGSVFTRTELKARERQQLDELATRVQGDLAALSMTDPQNAEAIGTGRALLGQLRNTEPVGRLVIDLDKVLSGKDLAEDLVLRDGDVLRVPQRLQSVTVIGEVQYATSHLYDARLSRNDYIDRSGGTTSLADERRIYVVRASGQVVVDRGSRFFARGSRVGIEPGDTIVVPLDTDRTKPLTLWTGVSQVLYNIAISVAAVKSF